MARPCGIDAGELRDDRSFAVRFASEFGESISTPSPSSRRRAR
ncbi:MAG TPA: hypothetical protein VMN35_05200 [Gaiellaceae bacterium]|nr:hypothetical protein [Gaiellaceae bacterium]